MIKSFLLILMLISYLSAISQSAKMKSKIGVSIPVIWNNSEATFYGLGRPYYPAGNAISYGLTISYCQPIYKGFYGKIGGGYFNQHFKIIRPFRYNNPIQLLYSTQSYNYNSLQLLHGLGYQKLFTEKNSIKCELVYTYYFSFRQKYVVQVPKGDLQINKNSISLGEMVGFGFGMERIISNKISLGGSFIIPIYTHWNKDEIFINNGYSQDEQQIARNKFSAGVVISCNYNF